MHCRASTWRQQVGGRTDGKGEAAPGTGQRSVDGGGGSGSDGERNGSIGNWTTKCACVAFEWTMGFESGHGNKEKKKNKSCR